jgi:hypothetical protein
MNEKIALSSLRHINIIYEGDFAELAHLLLKIEDAKHKGTNTTSRHTVKGVIGQYSLLTRMDRSQVMAKIAKYELPMGAIVEYDENIR